MSAKINKKSGLGRGLDALLPIIEEETTSDAGVKQVDIDDLQVSPYQPRKYFDPEALAELASSVAQKGILQPLLVRPIEDGYEIVAGERRFQAAKQAGLQSVPVLVRELDNQETLEIAIIENLQREDLNPVEEAKAFKQLMGFGMNQEKVAEVVGKSRSAVANTLRLLNLPDSALDALDKGDISAGHARAILSLPEEYHEWALEQILNNNLSVREAEKLQVPASEDVVEPSAKETKQHYEYLEDDLTRHVGTKVKIKGKDKGRVELHFHSTDELERLLELLGYQA